MKALRDLLAGSPAKARVAPFAIFLGLTFLQGQFGVESKYWMYAVKTLVGAALIWAVWPLVPEMRWKMSWEAVVAGILVFALWVGLDPFYPKMGKPVPEEDLWNPFKQFGEGSAVAWAIVAVRILGSGFVVPPLEEAFYRSFVYRYLINPDFEKVALTVRNGMSFAITAIIFGFAHYQWLGGILCAVIYQALVIRKGRLGDAMTAHAITNILLGIWVVWKKDWIFW